MSVPSPGQDSPTHLEEFARSRHELLTPINHILGLTEIQIDEASETGLYEYVPALMEINLRGRTLLAIIEGDLEGDLAPLSCPSDLRYLGQRIRSEAEPTLSQSRKLAEQLHAAGHSAAEDVDLVSSALVMLIAISDEMVQALCDRGSAAQSAPE